MSAKKKSLLSKLPVSLGTLSKIGSRVLRGLGDAHLQVLVDKSALDGVLSYAHDQLFPLGDSVTCTVLCFDEERPHLNVHADLNLLIAGKSDYNSLLISQADEFELPLVTLACDFTALVDGLGARLATDAGQTSIEDLTCDIIPLPTAQEPDEALLEAIFAELGRWVARHLPDTRQAFARAYPFMRHSVAVEIINSTAFANAVIAAAFFIPGADMPVLSANQARMLIQIASIYGLELSAERLKEAAVLLVTALGSRTLARQIIARLSVVAWAVRGSLAFGATTALGHAALVYYEKSTAAE